MTGPWQFRITVAEPPGDRQLDALYARCADVVVEADPAGGLHWLAFDRAAPTLLDAVLSAVDDLRAVEIGPVETVPDDDLVSPWVIAERVDRLPEVIGRWASGAAGPGAFPAALFGDLPRPCYRWREVARWLGVHFGHSPPDDGPVFEAVNSAFRTALRRR